MPMNESARWNLRFGFLDETIRSFAARNQSLFRSRSALVTCVDSCPTPGRSNGWLKLLRTDGIVFDPLADFVWIPSLHLAKAMDLRGGFPGFSEIYLVQEKPASAAGIAKRFTSDGVIFSEALPDEVAIQMRSVGADGYFSDGCGLNFVLGRELSELVHQTV